MPKQNPRMHADYRPKSYWPKGDAEAVVVRGIRDKAKKSSILEAWRAGKISDNTDTNEDEDEDYNENDDFCVGSVTILEILLKSVNSDGISLVATPLPDGRIKLKWYDDYGSGFLQPFETIDHPLSHAEMIKFIEASSQEDDYILPLCYNKMNFENDPYMSVEDLRKFTRIESQFYPGLSKWLEGVVEEWLTTLEFERD